MELKPKPKAMTKTRMKAVAPMPNRCRKGKYSLVKSEKLPWEPNWK